MCSSALYYCKVSGYAPLNLYILEGHNSKLYWSFHFKSESDCVQSPAVHSENETTNIATAYPSLYWKYLVKSSVIHSKVQAL